MAAIPPNKMDFAAIEGFRQEDFFGVSGVLGWVLDLIRVVMGLGGRVFDFQRSSAGESSNLERIQANALVEQSLKLTMP